MALTGKPLVLSSGMSSLEELDKAAAFLKKLKASFAILQCTTSYPCPPEKIGLNNISNFKDRYKCPVGLSDHSGNIYSSLAAVSLKANIIEVHVVFDKDMFGPDVSSSITFKELQSLVEGANHIHKILMNPIDKDKIANSEMSELRYLFQKSIVLSQDLEAGTKLEAKHLRFKKPGKGMSPDMAETIIRKILKRSLPADHFIKSGDLK